MRWTACLLICTLLAGVAALPVEPAAAGEASANADGLQDILEKGLRARLPRDFVFIGRVVAMVKNDELPLPLVLGAFDWVRRHRADRKYLVAYFEQVLRSRAARLGIKI